MSRSLWRWIFPPVVMTLGYLLLWRSLPLSVVTAILLSLLWGLLMLCWWWFGLRSVSAAGQSGEEVILLGGPAAAGIMGQLDQREGIQQRWLHFRQAEALSGWNGAGCRVRGLVLLIEPDRLPSDFNGLSAWRQAWRSQQRQLGHRLPVSLLIMGALGMEQGECLDTSAFPQPVADLSAARLALQQQGIVLQARALATVPENRMAALRTLVAWQCLARYVEHHLLPRLLPENQAGTQSALTGIYWMESGNVVPDSGYQQEVIAACGLLPAQRQARDMLMPLPEALAAAFPAQLACWRWLQRWSTAAAVMALFFAAFSLGSAWNNQQLIQQTQALIQAYKTLAPEQEPLRGKAAERLQAWQADLARSSDAGIPLRLGMGLYQGYRLARISNDVVRSYRPPKPEPEVLRLDNTALFDSGKATLKPQAKLALQSVLVWIQANPAKRVLIDGHSDSIGSQSAKLKLSLARAQAVKNWLVSASTFPETHFAVQGLGDTRPLASNDDEAGRSKNRRVEITLIQPPA